MLLLIAAGTAVIVLCAAVPLLRRALRRGGGSPAGRRRAWSVAAAALLGVPALTSGLYSLGTQWQAAGGGGELTEEALADAEAAAANPDGHIYAQLERQLKRHPDDERALVLKARLDMRAGRYQEAASGFERALARKAKVARDAGVWVEYAEARGMLQGRSMIGEPLKLVETALALDATHQGALDLAGSAAWELRDFAKAVGYWSRLLAQIPADSPRHAQLSLAIEGAQQRAKLSLRSQP